MVPLIVMLLSVVVILTSGHLIMRAERRDDKNNKHQPIQNLAQSSWGERLEDFFVAPFVPSSLEAFAGFLFAFASLQTITMAFARDLLVQLPHPLIPHAHFDDLL